MRRIDKPLFNVKNVFLDCISIIKDPNLKGEFNKCLSLLEEAEKDFEEKFKTNEIHKIPQRLALSGSIGKIEMEKVYTDRMAKKNKPARIHYDALFALAPGGKCPLCSQRVVRTLDHYLPKAKYPIYSVTPINLIPSCTDCNKDKLVDCPTKSEEETLHPYFDNVEDESWLKAKVLQTSPIGFEYYVQPPSHWSQVLKDRIANHFISFGLNTLYSVHAVEEYQNSKRQLVNLYKSGGETLLREQLNDAYESRHEIHKNSWQTALYEALLKDDWFCNGGLIA